MISSKLPKVFYGGDYNPEQWDEATHQEDLRMFRQAGIDIATVNVFSWAKIQSDEITYHFEWLDQLIDSLYESDIFVCLATSTAAHLLGWLLATPTFSGWTLTDGSGSSVVATILVRTVLRIENLRSRWLANLQNDTKTIPRSSCGTCPMSTVGIAIVITVRPHSGCGSSKNTDHWKS